MDGVVCAANTHGLDCASTTVRAVRTNLVLNFALLRGEIVTHLSQLRIVGNGRKLRLNVRLQTGLGLGHELGAHVVP